MKKARSSPTRDDAASKLRRHIWSTPEGERLGNEDDLISLLGVSRNTVRQVARLLEQEGLLRVRRGNSGGYFASRPNVEIIQSTVSSYLQMQDVDDEEATELASLLWVFAVQIACRKSSPEFKTVMSSLKAQVKAVGEESTFDDVQCVEEESRAQVFKLIESPYIALMFQINKTFAMRHFPGDPSEMDGTPEHKQFVELWKKAKLLELEAISDGDTALGELASKRSRSLFHHRLWDWKNRIDE